MASAEAAASAAVEASLRRADRIYTQSAPALREMLASADKALAAKLQASLAKSGGPTGKFGEQSARLALKQTQLATAYVEKRLLGFTHEQARFAVQSAFDETVRLAKTLETRFVGITKSLNLEQAAVMHPLVSGTSSSLLSRHVSSTKRYGAAMVQDFERVIRGGFMSGASNDEMIRALVGAGASKGFTAASLASAEPGYFPKPTGFMNRQYWAERIVRTECFLDGDLVTGAHVRAASRRQFSGYIVKVKTAGGRFFSCTPNHPMLTRFGWVGAGFLREGDDLLCSATAKQTVSSGDQHVDHGPATIGQVFGALQAIGVREGTGGAYPDFHGDVSVESQVDVFRIDRPLVVGHLPEVGKHCHELLFSGPNFARPFFCDVCGKLFTGDEAARLGWVSDADPRVYQTAIDGSRVHAQGSRDGYRRFPGHVSGNDALGREQLFSGVTERAESIERSVGSPSSEASAFYCSSCGANRATHSSGDPFEGKPGLVELDRVVFVHFEWFSGHVFNLETVHGYYAIDGVYSMNCAFAYNRTNLDTIKAAQTHDFPDMQKKILATFDMRTAPDSIAVHGQIRNVDDNFRDGAGREYLHPPARPNDRETVIPWRPMWPETEATSPPSAKVTGDASAAATPGMTPEQTKTAAMAAIQAQKLQLEIQAKERQIAAAVAKSQAVTAKAAKAAAGGLPAPSPKPAELAAQKAQEAASKKAEKKAQAAAKAKKAEEATKAQAAKEEAKKQALAAKALAAAKAKEEKAAALAKAKAKKSAALAKAKADALEAKKVAEDTAKAEKAAAKQKALDTWKMGPLPPVPPGTDFKITTYDAAQVPGAKWVDIHSADGSKIGALFAKDGKFLVQPPASVPFPAMVFDTLDDKAKAYALKISAEVAKLKPQAKPGQAAPVAAPAKVVPTMPEKERVAVLAEQRAKLARAEKLRLDTLPTVPIRQRQDEEMVDFSTEKPTKWNQTKVQERGRAVADAIGSEARYRVRAFTGSGYIHMRESEQLPGGRLRPLAQRTEDMQTLKKGLDAAVAAGHAVPDVELWRGVKLDRSVAEKILASGEFDHWGTASTSRKQSVALGFGGVTYTGNGTAEGIRSARVSVLYRMKNKTGVPVESLSGFGASEAEFMVRAGVRYRTTNAYWAPTANPNNTGARVLVLEGEEIED